MYKNKELEKNTNKRMNKKPDFEQESFFKSFETTLDFLNDDDQNNDYDEYDSFNEIFQLEKCNSVTRNIHPQCSTPFSDYQGGTNLFIQNTKSTNNSKSLKERYESGSMPVYENNKLVWTFEQTKRLVRAYQNVPRLNNNNHNWTKIREVANLSDFAIDQLKNKIKNLKKTNNLHNF